MKSNNLDLSVVISEAIVIWFWTIILGISISISREFIDSINNVYRIGLVFLAVIPLVAIGLYLFYKVFHGLLQSLPLVLQLLVHLLKDGVLKLSLSSAPIQNNNEDKTGLFEKDKEKNISESDEEALRSKIEKFPKQMMDIFRNVFFLYVLALIIRFILAVFVGLGFAKY